MSINRKILFLALSALLSWGAPLRAAEFEVLDRFTVDGYSVLRGSADISGGNFSVGGSTFVIKEGKVGIGTTDPNAKLRVVGESNTVVFPLRIAKESYADTGGHTSLIGFGVENSVWSKGAIGYTRTGSYDTGYLGFYLNGVASTADVSTSDVKMVINKDGNIGIGTTNPAANLDIGGTGSIKIPVGSTAERPSVPVSGMLRINTTNGRLEYYYNGGWNSVGAVAATGGTVSDAGGYRIHTFTSGGAITFTTGGTVEVLVVAGGGGGRGDRGAGGGAGGLIYQPSFTVAPQTYSVTVGAGGAGGVGVGAYAGVNGGNSIFSSLTAVGGGYGGRYGESNGSSGGSGGGGAGSGTSGQGNAGGSGNGSAPGGGGGAGAVGQTAPNATTGGNGGVGLAYSISGSSVYYAGGGGAGRGMDTGTSRGLGGLGGGGDGGNAGGAAGSPGAANTGGGGGGGANIPQGDGGTGGSGIVIIRYQN